MTNDATTEGGALIRIQMMTRQFAACHPTDGMDEVLTVKIFKTVLVQIMCVGPMVELMGGRVLNPILVTSVLGECQDTEINEGKGLT